MLESALLMTATAGAVSGLAALARSEGRPWAVVEALVLGPSASASASAPSAVVDLRFWTFVAAVGTALTAVVAFPGAFRPLPPGELAFVLLLGLPLLAVGQAAAADLLRRRLPLDDWLPQETGSASRSASRDASRDASPGGAPSAPAATELAAQCERAAREVQHARAQTADAGRLAALDALAETVSEYAAALAAPEGPGEPEVLRARLRGVITLARSCLAEEVREAARTLGVLPDATPEAIDAVFAALARIYDGPGALPGTSAERYEELKGARARLRRRPTAADGAPILIRSDALRRRAG